MSDDRIIRKDVDTATLFDRVEASRTETVNRIIDLLKGATPDYDSVDQVLDDFAFNVRFETIYLYENLRNEQADEDDEDDEFSLGSCGCTDYHMADCPTREYQ